MQDIVIRTLFNTSLVLLGYLAHHLIADVPLEYKRKALEEDQRELDEREECMRRGYQYLLKELSRIKAETFEDNPSIWSESDDAFLASWIKADE